MARQLAATVVLSDESGQSVVWLAGSEPDAASAKQITNPKAWGDEPDDARDASAGVAPVVKEPPAADDKPKEPAKKAPAKKAAAKKAAASK